MDRLAFRQVVTQFEEEHHREPEKFLREYRRLVGLGYVVLAGSLVLSLALVAALIWIAFLSKGQGASFIFTALVAVGGLGLSVLRGLLVRLDAPEGHEVRRKDAPALFAEIDAMVRELQCRPVHRVLLTNEMNAAMAQVPRFGILGGYRNELVLGVPLLYALPWEQFRSVIAHELGHLSHGHGAQASLAYRQRITWVKLVGHLQERNSLLDRPLLSFLKWFWPRLHARLFVLSRASEREADAAAARLSSPSIASQALMTINGTARRVGESLQNSWKAALLGSETPVPLEYEAPVRSRIDDAWVATDLIRSLRCATDVDDTHPSLSERLCTIGDPEMVATLRLRDNRSHATEEEVTALALQMEERRVAQVSAAQHYFPGGPGSPLERFREEEMKQLALDWPKLREPLVTASKQRAELEAKEAAGTATVEERLQLAGLINLLEGQAAAFRKLEELHAAAPENPEVLFHFGRLLLDQRRDERGIAMIEKAMAAAPLMTADGLSAIVAFLSTEGRHAEVERFRQLGDRHAEEMSRAREERTRLNKGDLLIPHGLDAQKLAKCVEALRSQAKVKRAWLFQKSVRYLPTVPCHIVVLEFSLLHQRDRLMEKVARQLVEQLAPHLGSFMVVTLRLLESRWLAKHASEHPEAIVYTRGA
jgi:Zn-dependent protease with chaperone function